MTSVGNEYERLRAQRMLDNQLRMKQYGIQGAVAAVRPKAVSRPAPRPKRKRETQPSGPTRKSARNEGKPVPVYTHVAEPKVHVQRVAKTARSSGRGGFRSGIDPDMFPYATPKAIAEAQDAAEALADQLNEKAGHSIAAAKGLQKSQVSGGFWMQNPQIVTDNIDSASKLKIQLECFEPCQQEEGYTRGVDGSQTRWGVVYLPRPSGSGMSGGWIHFAVDHELTPNDTVVFEVVSEKGPKFVRIHIFRAKLAADA